MVMSELNALLGQREPHLHTTSERLSQIESVIKRPIPKELIKQRDTGYGKQLNYISGATVVNLLNEAFGIHGWSFTVKNIDVCQSQPKEIKRQGKPTGEFQPQPPFVLVLGQLVIHELGIVKEQFGSKTLIGGASEQEAAAKAAATDAMKKCATLVGIGLELYESDETAGGAKTYDKPRTAPRTVVGPAKETSWDPADLKRIKEYKAVLEITDNTQLDPYVREFLNKSDASFKDITPANIAAFNKFMSKKVEEA